jgi:Icc-related predicted phosphoesterase
LKYLPPGSNAHQGFEALLELLDDYRPAVLGHGHVHLRYGLDQTRERTYGSTRVINACERYVFEIPDAPYDLRHHGEVIYKTRRKREDMFDNAML